MAYLLVDPQSKLDWQFQWDDFLATGDSISSRQWSISPTHGDSPETPTLTNATSNVVTVSALNVGNVYRLTERITTANGIIADRTIVLRCDQR